MKMRLGMMGLLTVAVFGTVRAEVAEPDSNFNTGYDYTLRFYPRWMTWTQLQLTAANSPDGKVAVNKISGPVGMGPEYKIVVAINDDTIYAQAFLELAYGPQVLTIPAYSNKYSILQLDVFGNVLKTTLSELSTPIEKGGTFVFVLPDFAGPLPAGSTKVVMPCNASELIIRADKYTSANVNVTAEATAFRDGLLLHPLEKYDPKCAKAECGKTFTAPLFFYSAPVKMMADESLTFSPTAFLDTLQLAMSSPSTQPLDTLDNAVIKRFNVLFDKAKKALDTNPALMSEIVRGAQAAHKDWIDRWQSHRNPNNWIHFDNVGEWGTNYLDRAALTEYIQYGNNATAAYYADAFVDGDGIPLNGKEFAYSITFEAGTLPDYSRFWSLTAYTPGDVELVENPLSKYVVASYTPGLVGDPKKGPVTIYIQAESPSADKQPNWLPIPKGPFNMLFRVYGPEGRTKAGDFTPPKIKRLPVK